MQQLIGDRRAAIRTVTVTAKSERDAQKQLAVKVAEAERGIVANAPARLTVSIGSTSGLPQPILKSRREQITARS